jgi:REP element-mobilizing transposase RayT
MTQSRKTVVSVDEVGVYHCMSRCVRRAFLCGEDPYSGRNYEHRREWVRQRIEFLSEVFGMEVFAYSVMSNHLHLVLRSRPDWVLEWSEREVAQRWCRLFQSRASRERGDRYDTVRFTKLLADEAQLQLCRQRLKDLSWFMRCLDEPLARRANREDGCSGRFWEGRFKCQRLLNAGAILACMAYVDLNPVRAGMADELIDSQFTSVYDRMMACRASSRLKELGAVKSATYTQKKQIEREQLRERQKEWLLDLDSSDTPFSEVDTDYYLRLVEWTGQNIRADKLGYIPLELESVLNRFELDAANWCENVKSYGSLFHRMVGRAEQLLDYAQRQGQRWFRGRAGSEQLFAAAANQL